jgi:hypothetical protein
VQCAVQPGLGVKHCICAHVLSSIFRHLMANHSAFSRIIADRAASVAACRTRLVAYSLHPEFEITNLTL